VGQGPRRGPGQARTAPVAQRVVPPPPADRAPVDGVPGRALALPTLFTIAGAVLLADQLTKVWAVAALEDGPFELVGPLSFRLHRNTGAAFSLFTGITPVLAVLAVVLTVVLVRLGSRATDGVTAVGLAVVLGGALGNLVDRLVRDPGFLEGAVVDFIRYDGFPTFNVADSAITLGVAAILLRSVLAGPGALAGATDGDDRAGDDASDGDDGTDASDGDDAPDGDDGTDASGGDDVTA
jgi:signal peptidase II